MNAMAGKAPYLISWNITRRCNLSCAHCYLDSTALDGAGDITTEEAMRFVDEITSLNPGAMLVLTGGEPLLRPDIFEITGYAASGGLTVFLGTNGTLLDEAAALRLVRSGVKGVGVSIDSLTPSYHDSFRGVEGAWEKAVNGVEALKGAGLDFQIQFTITKDNRNELPQIIDFSRRRGARALNIFFLVCTGRGQELTDLDQSAFESTLREIAEARSFSNNGLMIRARCAPQFLRVLSESDPESPLLRGATSGCIAGKNYLRISPDGHVTPCPYIPADGNSPNLSGKGLVEIWREDKQFISLRDHALEGPCGGCAYEKLCGGCRARAVAGSKDLMGEDPSCGYPSREETRRALRDEEQTLKEAVWTDEARERLERVPEFLRGMVAAGVERYALAKGIKEITPEVMSELKSRLF